jgi:hypothetical protein
MSDRQPISMACCRYLDAAYYQAVRGEGTVADVVRAVEAVDEVAGSDAAPRGPARVKAAGRQPDPARWPDATAAAGGCKS